MTLMLHWPVWVYQLPMRMRCRCAWACHLAPVTFDLGDMALTLEILNESDAHGSILGGAVGVDISYILDS